MNSNTRHSLVQSALFAGTAVMEKSANAAPAQLEILENAWPSEDEGITKKAQLSRVIATGILVEQAEASMEQ